MVKQYPKKQENDSRIPISRIVAVSNRLPISIEKSGNSWKITPGTGGLVTAMAPILRNRGGLWIGWSGTTEELDWKEISDRSYADAGYQLHPVTLSTREIEGFYEGFSNQIIWPLFHDLQTICNFDPEFWRQYMTVDEKFADVIGKYSISTDFIWVHDYHLMNVAQYLRQKDIHRQTAFFLHIPFPALDIFLKLPWRGIVLRALLEYDLIGFQTMRDMKNFTQCLHYLIKGVKVSGRGAVQTVTFNDNEGQGREVRVGTFPISIDFNSFAGYAASEEVDTHARWLKNCHSGVTIYLGVDRLDYTKGVPERLNAFRSALERYPELRRNITLIQVVVPSRETVSEYQTLKAHIEQLVGEINGQFSTAGWIPIHYQFRYIDRHILIASYRAAHVGLVTPLKDGMNLVAKEYCASNLSEEGVLILSQFAGAAAQLQKGAIMVNPYDIEGMADAIHTAFHMDIAERRLRMKRLRESIRRHNVFRWVDSYLNAAMAKKLGDFPPLDQYIPKIEFGSLNGS